MAQLNSEIKIAIKNTLLYFSDKDFNPQSFLDILCAECRNIGINFDECDWFGAWSAKFEGAIRNELARSPIKTRDDFIDKIAQICNHKSDKNALDTLQKALAILKAHGIIDFSANLPLNAIDLKLSALLESKHESKPKSHKLGESNSAFLSNLRDSRIKIDKNQKILLCNFSEQAFIKKLDSGAYNRLLHSFCALLLNKLDSKNIIGIYKNAVAIFSKQPIDALKSEIEKILEIHTFMLHNKPLRLKIDFKIIPFGSLK